MKNTYVDFVSSIGNTPLIKLRGPSEKTGCNIYGKAEFLNPGGSVKDRAAWALIKDAEDKQIRLSSKKEKLEREQKITIENLAEHVEKWQRYLHL